MAEIPTENYYRYDTRPDAWSVIFPNKSGLSKSEVEEIFSKFGPIKIIIQTGDSTGFCIVKFTSKDAAINCITASPEARNSIKMKEFHKNRSENVKRNSSKTDNSSLQRDPNKNNYSVSTLSDRLKRLSAEPVDNRNSSKENKNSELNGFNKNESMNHQSNGLNSKENCQVINTGNHVKLMKNDKLNRTKFQVPPRTPNFNQQSPKKTNNSVLHEQKGRIELKHLNNLGLPISPQQENEIGEINGFLNGLGMSSLSIDAAGLPAGLPELKNRKYLVCNGPCCREAPAPPGLHEIMVMNIDEAADVGFILNLLKDFEPLYISNMKVHEEKKFRYCHVYFKSFEHAEAVERTYDRLKIYGKELIVLRPESFVGCV